MNLCLLLASRETLAGGATRNTKQNDRRLSVTMNLMRYQIVLFVVIIAWAGIKPAFGLTR